MTIDQSRLNYPYEKYTIRSKVPLICDYCGINFERVKKSVGRLNKIVTKDSCGSKKCSQLKREEVCNIQYGTSSIFQSEGFKKTTKETIQKRYGSDSYFSSEEFKNSRIETLREKYGVDNPLQNEEIKNRQKKTCLERYGTENFSQSDEYKERIGDIREKVEQTCLEKYGVPVYTQHEDYNKKRIGTNKERYGIDHPSKLHENRQKAANTNEERFGVRSFSQTEEYRNNYKNTCLDRYGVSHASKLPETIDKARETSLQKYGKPHYSQTEERKSRVVKTCFDRFGVPNRFCLCTKKDRSKTQKILLEWLNEQGCNFVSDDYSVLINRELDLYDKQLKIAIEYCGLYWHTELSPNPREKNYHYDKYIRCKEAGIRLVTIFEDEWIHKPEQCKNILQAIVGKCPTKLFARKCQARELDKSVFVKFCSEHHLLGANNSGSIFSGLYHKDELVGVMSIGKHHRNKQKTTLDRMCFKSGTYVIGGASKLLNFCRQFVANTTIITWSDNRWSTGKVYEIMGFSKKEDLKPDYSYVHMSNAKFRLSKQSQKKSNTSCPKEITERDWSIKSGLARIWDCGKIRWELNGK